METLPAISDWRVIEQDVRCVDYEEFGAVDLVAGGAPCQPFSIGGRHVGMDDKRNMIPEFIRAIRALSPRAFILENVRGLLRPAFHDYFSYVTLELTYPGVQRKSGEDWTAHYRRLKAVKASGSACELQYSVYTRLFNAADYGVPQTRTRVFLVGFQADAGIDYRFPNPTHDVDALLRAQWVTGEYWERHGVRRPATPTTVQSTLSTLANSELLPKQPWRTVRDALSGLPEPCLNGDPAGILNHRLIPGARSYPGHTGSVLDLPAKTLKAGVHGVPGGENTVILDDGSVRYFSVRESARVQTFPDPWRFEGSWSETMRQLGNAVPMDLAAIVARSVALGLRPVNGG
jgi:DNA (cytosine-5)-methyltransferase 1